MLGRLAVLLASGLALAAPAAADVRPLAQRDGLGVPVLDGDRVVYADADRDALSVLVQPVGGGRVTELARLPEPPTRFVGRPGWDLDAGLGGLALRMYPAGGAGRLFAGPPEGPLALVQRRAAAGPAAAEERDLFAVPGGPLVVERTDRLGALLRAVLRPPGADLHHLAVAGALAAVAVPRRGEIVLLDLPSGAVRARVPLGDFDGEHVAWATDGCQLVADVDSPRVDAIPRGPCLRTEAAFTLEVPSSVRVKVRCIAAPGPRCRIDLRVYGRSRRLARRVVTVPRRRERTVRVPVRAEGGITVLYGRVVDPDGRRRLAVIL